MPGRIHVLFYWLVHSLRGPPNQAAIVNTYWQVIRHDGKTIVEHVFNCGQGIMHVTSNKLFTTSLHAIPWKFAFRFPIGFVQALLIGMGREQWPRNNVRALAVRAPTN